MRTPRAGTAPRPGGTPPRGHLSAGRRGPKACRASQGTGTATCRPWDVTSKCGHFAGQPGHCSIDGTLHTSPWKRVARTRRPSEGVAAGRGDTDPPGRSHTPPSPLQTAGARLRAGKAFPVRVHKRTSTPAQKVHRSPSEPDVGDMPRSKMSRDRENALEKGRSAVRVLHLAPTERRAGRRAAQKPPGRGREQGGGAPAARQGQGREGSR